MTNRLQRSPRLQRFTVEEFMAEPRWPNNTYVREPGFRSLYIRRTMHGMEEWMGDLQIANLTVEKPGTGTLTRALDIWEKKWSIYFEMVSDERFQAYLMRRGYVPVRGHPTCFIRRIDADGQ